MGSLKSLLNPKTIAILGATERDGAFGRIVMENLIKKREKGLFPINPKKNEVFGIPCYKRLSDIKEHIDLAVIATPFKELPKVLKECAIAGVDVAMILSSPEKEDKTKEEEIEQSLKEIGKRYGLKIIGPQSLGFIRPVSDLNLSLFDLMPEKGGVAFLSQSAGMSRAFLNWGIDAHIGLSIFLSFGSMIDVDFGEFIDLLGEDIHTRSIVIYMEERIGNVKRFVSACKGFAMNKPIIVLKPRKEERREDNPLTYSAIMIEKDRIYDAVFKRLGVLRVKEARDLFNLATVLHAKRLPSGPRLLIITNALGAGLMASNALKEEGGELAEVSDETMVGIREIFGSYEKKDSPVLIPLDADLSKFIKTVEICLREKKTDGLLVLYTPQGKIDSFEFANSLSEIYLRARKPMVVCLFGGKDRGAKEILVKNNIPTYDTPEEAVRTYLYLYKYERNLRSLYETPRDLSLHEIPPNNNLKIFLKRVLKEGVEVLTDNDSQKFLECYGIPTLKTFLAGSLKEAILICKEIGYPVVMKISSPDTIHRADFGGVITGINSEEEVKVAYEKLLKRVEEVHPKARIKGIAIQRMIEKIDYEVVLGAKKDEEFGSIILFGMGGVGLRIFKDLALGLPPLNQTLAKRMMEDTHIFRILLQGYGDKPPADIEQLESIIVSFSNIITDFPEIKEMDVNPIVISDGKAYALDARIVIDKDALNSNPHLSHIVITPYPTRYIIPTTLRDGRKVILRPIRPEDEPLEREMLSSLSEETIRGRFFTVIKDITHEMLVKFCNIDYDREMAIVAEITEGDKRRIIGIGRLIIDPDFERGECAVVVHDDFQRKGLGLRLMDVLLGIGEEKRLKEIYGIVQSGNKKMLNLAKKLGFSIEVLPDNMCMIKVQLC